MKGKRIPSSAVIANNLNLNGKRAVIISKNSRDDIILRRLRESILYTKLRSLLPPQHPQVTRDESVVDAATEMELEPHEIPERDSDEEISHHAPTKEDEDVSVVFESDEGEEEMSKPFVPSIKIKRMDGSILINIIVLKDVCLSSSLFEILEEEKLDIVFENQYRTESKVAHTIHVKLPFDYNIDALESRLCTWARRAT